MRELEIMGTAIGPRGIGMGSGRANRAGSQPVGVEAGPVGT